ncbi:MULTISPECIES: Crp/Fnr family transcriptional regulator [unclassified Robiginitalea]|uniref:Crp/Fnr family transcriptional regulator n=1 Tax=Robiginitalea TaxID=252306 RepID=UPI00234A5B31|nr:MULTISPECIES: Crp/Fnr family transcriptional regulator [unclassified Robiginitalea]MDC6355709.1 Crp/Fnr family transcriptional regulator [Robiginitalea sp. PM2]MDC6376088.1 Crp/Fnr family transcriptional regulator [Robiginitalea sp. SP8]
MYSTLFNYLKEKAGVDRGEFNRFSHYFKSKRLKKNETVLREGEICKGVYFVNNGCLRFFHLNEEGKELTRYFAFEGKFGTDLTSLITNEPSKENIQSIEQSEILYIIKTDFYELVKTEPSINLIYRDILEMAYVTSVKRIYNFQGEETLERLKWLMNYQPRILSRLSNKMIATYLGITPYTLSRLKSKL